MAAFIYGDTPVADFDYDVPAAADVDSATVALSVDGQTLDAALSGSGVVGSWRGVELPEPGMHPVHIVVSADGRSERALTDWLVVCDPTDQWHNVITARLEWSGAPDPDGTLHRLLEVAREQVEAYGPTLDADGPVPERYRAAQLIQARNTWNASLTNGDAQVDAGGFVVNVRPLDWAVKQLIRPLTTTKAFG